MQEVDNHMDDLFKKAAEDYPLRVSKGKFDDIMPLVGNVAGNTTQANSVKPGKNRLAILLLSILILFVGTDIVLNHVSKPSPNQPTSNVSEKIVSPVTKSSVDVKNSTTATSKSSKEEESISTELAQNTKTSTQISKDYSSINKKGETGTTLNPVKKKFIQTKIGMVPANEENTREQNFLTLRHSSPLPRKIQGYDRPKPAIIGEGILNPSNLLTGEPPIKIENKTIKPKPSLYFGLVVGSELNRVKEQEMNRPSFNGGLMVGLKFSKKFSIETGVLLAQKKYYSEGRYFKPKAGSMPANMLVKSLQSECNFIEIPLSIKYDLSTGPKKFYLKAGFSSFVLTKEKNNYDAMVGTQPQEIVSLYQTNRTYLAAAVRLSGGYQIGMRKGVDFRIEPYLQVPTRGIGVGFMPLSTAGLQILLTRK